MKKAFAKDTFKAWFDSNQTLIAEFVHSQDLDSKSGRAAWASIHMPSHTVGISAWDHENKLEIIMIDVATDQSVVEDRAYSSRDSLRDRLDSLLQQLLEMREC